MSLIDSEMGAFILHESLALLEPAELPIESYNFDNIQIFS